PHDPPRRAGPDRRPLGRHGARAARRRRGRLRSRDRAYRSQDRDRALMTSAPPLGWNSWDCFGTTVTEDEVMANAEVMVRRLLPFGWDTVVVDIQWYDPTARSHGYNDDAPLLLDAFGIHQPAPNRFPSSSDGSGFTSLAGRV